MKKAIPVYICVSGKPSHSEDSDIPGAYLTRVDADLDPALQASAALDCFHERCPIRVLDDFSIIAVDQNGAPLVEPDGQESYQLGKKAEYCGALNPDEVPFGFNPDGDVAAS